MKVHVSDAHIQVTFRTLDDGTLGDPQPQQTVQVSARTLKENDVKLPILLPDGVTEDGQPKARVEWMTVAEAERKLTSQANRRKKSGSKKKGKKA